MERQAAVAMDGVGETRDRARRRTGLGVGIGAGSGDPPVLVAASDVDAAFRGLYRERYVAMVRLATLLVDRVEVAEDITQDAFAAVYGRWDELDSPAGYLRLTVVNRCRDALRRRRLDRRHQPRPEVAVDAPDELADAIAGLPARQRVAVVLRFYEDLTVDQIAEVMGTRPGTVKSWLNRAMTRLRQEIPR